MSKLVEIVYGIVVIVFVLVIQLFQLAVTEEIAQNKLSEQN